MCTIEEGRWHVILPEQTLADVLRRVGLNDEPVSRTDDTLPVSSAFASFLARLGEQWIAAISLLWRHRSIVAAALVLIAVNVVAAFVLQDPHVREREILSQYETIWEEVGLLRDAEGNNEQWREFTQSALTQLEPVLAELKRTSSVQSPIRQNLLYAGHDHLVPLLSAAQAPTTENPSAKVFERYLVLLRQRLPDEVGTSQLSVASRR